MGRPSKRSSSRECPACGASLDDADTRRIYCDKSCKDKFYNLRMQALGACATCGDMVQDGRKYQILEDGSEALVEEGDDPPEHLTFIVPYTRCAPCRAKNRESWRKSRDKRQNRTDG